MHNFLGNIVVHIHAKYRKDRMKTEAAYSIWNKANMRDLIAAAGLVPFFGQRDLEIARMTIKNNHLQTINSDSHLRFLRLCNIEIWRMMIQAEMHPGEQ